MATATRLPAGRDRATWLIGLIGFLVSGALSWVPSIATDEAATISAATRSWAELDTLTRSIDAVHLGYYALMKLWFELVGVNAVTLRLPSALLVGLAGMLVVVLARQWLSRATALGAGVLAVVLPRATHIGIEGRGWALVVVLVLAATLALVRWQATGDRGWLAGYALAMGAGIVIEIYLVFVLVAHAISLLWLRVRLAELVQHTVAGLVAVGIGAPIIVRALGQTGQITSDQLELGTWLRHLLINQSFAGEPLGPMGWPSTWWRPAAAALAVLCWALVALLAWRWLRGKDGIAREVLAWCLPLLLVPGTLVASWSLVIDQNMYNPRYFSFSYAPMAICVALALRGRARAWLVVGLVTVLLVPGYVGQRMVNAKAGADWSQVAELLAARARSGDGVYFAAQPSTRPISIAYPEPFAQLVDLSLNQSPAAAGTLSGTNYELVDVVGDAPARVWAIWRSDDEAIQADVATFQIAGYQIASEWQGSRDTVTEFVHY